MFSKKIEKYTDSIIQNTQPYQLASYSDHQRTSMKQRKRSSVSISINNKNRNSNPITNNNNNNSIISQQNLRKLQLMGCQSSSQFYIQTLLNLNNTKQDKQIEQICYTQLGRKMVKVSQKQVHRQFQKTNIYIRAYMLRSIYEYVSKLASQSQNTIYILPNVQGLHFSTEKKPQQLNKYLQHSQYVEIIRNINYIIQNGLFQNKRKSMKLSYNKYRVAFIIFLCIFIAMGSFVAYNHVPTTATTAIANTQNNNQSLNMSQILLIIYGLILGLIMMSVLGFSMHSFHTKMQYKPLCNIIMDEIQQYFVYINGKYLNKLQWMIGDSFLWIQIKITDQGNYDKISQQSGNQFDEK